MNLPNKLTIARVLITPFFLTAMLLTFQWHWFVAAVFFAAASITDMLDGQIARKQGIVTTFGKFLDPLADKIMLVSAFIAFVARGLCHPLVAIIVVIREFLISSIRLLAVSSEGKVIQANIWGKIKTSVTMVCMIVVMAAMWLAEDFGLLPVEPVTTVSNILMWICALLTALSGVVYMVQNRSVLAELKEDK